MPAARIILCEETARWGLALRSLFTNGECHVVAAANVATAFSEVRQGPQAVLAVEVVEANAEQCLRELSTIRRSKEKCCVIVLLSESLADGDVAPGLAMWYEAGATAVVAAPHRTYTVYRLVHRHLETYKNPPTTFREDVWQRMPWSNSELTS